MIPLLKARVPPEAIARVADVLASGYVNTGPVCAEFEAALAQWLGADHGSVVLTNSCTSALALAVMLANAKTVVTTPMTFVATTTAIYQAGATPVWADVESQCSCQVDAGEAVATARHTQAGAIMAVAWAGWTPCLDAFTSGPVPVILDAAQALGASWRGQPIHRLADFTCYSFSPTKHLTAVDGGALVVRDPKRRDEARRLSWFGMRRTLHQGERVLSDQPIRRWGLKANLNDVGAAIGLAGLSGIDEALHRARMIARAYDAGIYARRDEARPECLPSPWLYTLFVDDPGAFIQHMARAGVAAAQPHRRNDLYSFTGGPRPYLPKTDAVQSRYVCLPVGWWLSEEDVARIVLAVNAYAGVVRG